MTGVSRAPVVRGPGEIRGGRADSGHFARTAYRVQSKNGPGSVLRCGAISEWPRTACSGYRPRRQSDKRVSDTYCGSVKGKVSVPSSSMPIEKSLHCSRPSKDDTPACQARALQETNCVTWPVRSIRKCADTRRFSRHENQGSAARSSAFRNKLAIWGVPNCPGGKLML